MSLEAFTKKYPRGIPKNKKSKDNENTFVCRKGLQQKTVTYTPEFTWEEEFDGTEDSMRRLLQFVDDNTLAPVRKRKVAALKDKPKAKVEYEPASESDHDSGAEPEYEVSDEEMQTPRKKRKTFKILTPRKLRTPSKLVTPSHKRYVL